jgi:hypothetical protein
MKRKVRKIVVDSNEYNWRINQSTRGLTLRIWKDKNNLLYDKVLEDNPLTNKNLATVSPKVVKAVIKSL